MTCLFVMLDRLKHKMQRRTTKLSHMTTDLFVHLVKKTLMASVPLSGDTLGSLSECEEASFLKMHFLSQDLHSSHNTRQFEDRVWHICMDFSLVEGMCIQFQRLTTHQLCVKY